MKSGEIMHILCKVKMKLCLFLLLARIYGQGTSKLFFRKTDKTLDAIPIETKSVQYPEQCLGSCLHNDRCKAINIIDDECELLAKNRCSARAMVDSPGTSYFDLVADGMCLSK